MSLRPTSNERDHFFAQYNSLVSALVLFHDPEQKTDAAIADEYVVSKNAATLEQLLTEGRLFLSQRGLPMELIAHYANRYLVTEAEQRQWLQTLLDRVQAELASRRKAEGASR